MPRHYGKMVMGGKKRVKALLAKRKRAGNVKGRGGWKLPHNRKRAY